MNIVLRSVEKCGKYCVYVCRHGCRQNEIQGGAKFSNRNARGLQNQVPILKVKNINLKEARLRTFRKKSMQDKFETCKKQQSNAVYLK